MSHDQNEPIVKNQHYVPRLYLRGFQRADKPEFLFVYDKKVDKQFSLNVANVANGDFFYDFPPEFNEPGDDSQKVEHFLRDEIEPEFGKMLDLLKDVEHTGVTPELHERLALFATYQYVRTADFRKGYETLFSAGSQPIREFAEREGFPGEIPDLSAIDNFTQRQSPVWHGAALTDPRFVAALAAPLLDHICYVGVNDTLLPFWTSDTPMTSTTNEPSAPIWGGLGMVGTEVRFPINHRLVCVMWERSHAEDRANLHGQCVHFDIENVKYCNAQQVAQCVRQVYSPTDDFSLVAEIRAKNPWVFTSERKIEDYFGLQKPKTNGNSLPVSDMPTQQPGRKTGR